MYKYGHLPFEFHDWIENFDFYNLGKETKKDQDSKLDRLKNQKRNVYPDDKVFVNVSTLKNNFSDHLFKYIDKELELDFPEAMISYFPPTPYESPGMITGWHKDSHEGYMERNGLSIAPSKKYKKIARYWVPLQDRKFGHYFEMTDETNNFILTDWRAGDVWRVFPKYPHVAASMGPSDRKLMIITGLIR